VDRIAAHLPRFEAEIACELRRIEQYAAVANSQGNDSLGKRDDLDQRRQRLGDFPKHGLERDDMPIIGEQVIA